MRSGTQRGAATCLAITSAPRWREPVPRGNCNDPRRPAFSPPVSSLTLPSGLHRVREGDGEGCAPRGTQCLQDSQRVETGTCEGSDSLPRGHLFAAVCAMPALGWASGPRSALTGVCLQELSVQLGSRQKVKTSGERVELRGHLSPQNIGSQAGAPDGQVHSMEGVGEAGTGSRVAGGWRKAWST